MRRMIVALLVVIAMAFFTCPALSLEGNYSVTDYGAVGDGLTDNRDAIQDTIDLCYSEGGGIVWFPGGVYLVGSTLIPKLGVTLRGVNHEVSVVKIKDNFPNNYHLFGNEWVSGIVLENLVFDGNMAHQGITSTADTEQTAIMLDTVDNLIVRGCHFKNWGKDAINIKDGENISITDCIFESTRRHSIWLHDGEMNKYTIIGNTFTDGKDMMYPVANSGIRIDPSSAHIDGVIIANNTFKDLEEGVILYRTSDLYRNDLSIRGNIFTSIVDQGAVYLVKGNGVLVEGNQFRLCGTVVDSDQERRGGAVTLIDSERVSILDNVMTQCRGYYGTIYFGNDCSGLVLDSNRFYKDYRRGIYGGYVSVPDGNRDIIDNTFLEGSQQYPGMYEGIFIGNTILYKGNGDVITGNRVRTGTGSYGDGVKIEYGDDGTIYTGNRIVGGNTEPIFIGTNPNWSAPGDGFTTHGGGWVLAPEVNEMVANETFTQADGIVFIKTPTYFRNFNPSGDFKAGTLVIVANQSLTWAIFFDSTALNSMVHNNTAAIFIFSGISWFRVD